MDNPKKNNIETKETTAQKGLKLFNNIFSVERKLNDLSPKEYYEKRLNSVNPKVEALKSWLETEDANISGKLYLKTAFRYSLNSWKNLTNRQSVKPGAHIIWVLRALSLIVQHIFITYNLSPS